MAAAVCLSATAAAVSGAEFCSAIAGLEGEPELKKIKKMDVERIAIMKKLFAILLTLALCLAGCALAEASGEIEEGKFNTLIEDGEFIIQVHSEGDLRWVADDMAQDPSVVELAFADTLEDTFVARYAPVGDGDMTVAVRHFVGAACDEVMTWDLHVENGAVTEVTGGSYTASPEDAVLDDALVGEWLEAETQFTGMTIEKNPESGWDVEIVSPVSHGAYVFKTSVLFDCELNSLVYDKGKFWDIDGNYDGSAELGEARTAGTTGSFGLVVEDDSLVLDWHDDDENPEGSIAFLRADAGVADDGVYVDPHGELAFNYDPEAFAVTYDSDDEPHVVVLSGVNADWGDYEIALTLRELEEGEGESALETLVGDGAEATRGEWNGFEDVIMYGSETDEAHEQVFVVPLKDADDGEMEDVLSIAVSAQKLEDEDAAMARDDAISAVLDSLTVLDD